MTSSGGGKAHPNWVLITTILASGLSFIDGSVVNVGLPAIANAFKAGTRSRLGALTWGLTVGSGSCSLDRQLAHQFAADPTWAILAKPPEKKAL